MDARAGDATVGELLGALVRESGSLVRQEMHLARTEISRKATIAASNGGTVLLGGALAHAGILALIGALVIGLSSFVPTWLSALVVGVLFSTTGFMMTHAGVSGLRNLDPLPAQTVETIKDVLSPSGALPQANEVWAKEKTQ